MIIGSVYDAYTARTVYFGDTSIARSWLKKVRKKLRKCGISDEEINGRFSLNKIHIRYSDEDVSNVDA